MTLQSWNVYLKRVITMFGCATWKRHDHRRILIAGVGYQHLRDVSLGPVIIERLRQQQWPPGVDIDDLNYGPIIEVEAIDENWGTGFTAQVEQAIPQVIEAIHRQVRGV